jgi:prolyl oligopeptidase
LSTTADVVPPAPEARRDDVVDVIHGVDVHDPYRWLEDGDAPETAEWTAAQNSRTRAVLDARPDRDELHRRATAALQAGASAAPRVAGPWVFSLDRWGDLDQAVLVVRPRDDAAAAIGEPRVLVDPHARTGDATAAIDWFHPSRDGRLLAYGVSAGGNERSTLHIVDVDSGEHLADEIPHTRAASVAWTPDNSSFAYTRYPADSEYDRNVFWHVIGTDPVDDPVVFDALPDPTAWPDVSMSEDGAWMLVHVALGWSRIDVHLIEHATDRRVAVIEGDDSVNGFEVTDGRLLGHTTNGAGRGRIVSAPLGDPTAGHWTTVVAESDAVIEGFVTTSASMLVVTNHRAVSHLWRHDLDGTDAEEIPLPELGSLAGLSGADDADVAVFSFTSFTRPASLFRWSPEGGAEAWSDLPGAPDASAYTVEQVRYPSTDGTDISMFLVRPAGVPAGASRPTILTAYGGFAVTMSPAYSPTAVAWCDTGGLFAVACIRGGAEEGEEWHHAGMREHKQQVFDDFHAAGDWLVANGLCTRESLGIRGGSNGGLLVGVALTQRPDLCRAVFCAVPLLDMVRFPRFLIARLWVPEYGDPDVADEFAWLYGYSPYHHVVSGTCYPAVLFATAEEDSRVDPCHARKTAALMQAATSCGDEHPILVRIETRAGHGQGKPVTKQADELADVLAFFRWQLLD